MAYCDMKKDLPLCVLTDEQSHLIEIDIMIAGRMMTALEHLQPQETHGGNREVTGAGWLSPQMRGGVLPLEAERCAYRYFSAIEQLLRTINGQRAIFADDDPWLATFNAPRALRLNPHMFYAERKWYDYLRH